MKKKKTLAGFLALCMALALLAGCTGNDSLASSPTPTPEPNTTQTTDPSGGEGDGSGQTAGAYLREKITVSSMSDGGTFDPYTTSAWGNCAMMDLIFQRLANIESTGGVSFEIAKSFEKVDDTHYTLTIWDCIYDSAGNQITADDIIWSFEQYIAAGNAGGVNRFDHFEKIDDYTLTWVANAPFALGELEKNLSNCKICDQTSYEELCNSDMTTTPIGSGPYKLETYNVGSTVVLVANEDFWMNKLEGVDLTPLELQNVHRIEYQIIQDTSSRAIALEMGNIEIADDLDSADVDAFKDNPDISPVLFPRDPPIAMIFNCSDNSPFADVRLRQAFCYGLDNEAIAAALAVPAYPVYGIHPRMWDAPSSWMEGRSYYDYDPDKARELVDASGYDGSALVLQYTSSTAFDGAVIMMHSQLKDVGINIELLALEDSVRNVEKWKPDTWDVRLETMGGGNYLIQVLKTFSSQDASAHLDGGLQVMMVADKKLDELWDALAADTNDETIKAWDDYFTYEMCYGYAICCYSDQSACSSDVNVTQIGTRSVIVPSAATFN